MKEDIKLLTAYSKVNLPSAQKHWLYNNEDLKQIYLISYAFLPKKDTKKIYITIPIKYEDIPQTVLEHKRTCKYCRNNNITITKYSKVAFATFEYELAKLYAYRNAYTCYLTFFNNVFLDTNAFLKFLEALKYKFVTKKRKDKNKK